MVADVVKSRIKAILENTMGKAGNEDKIEKACNEIVSAVKRIEMITDKKRSNLLKAYLKKLALRENDENVNLFLDAFSNVVIKINIDEEKINEYNS